MSRLGGFLVLAALLHRLTGEPGVSSPENIDGIDHIGV